MLLFCLKSGFVGAVSDRLRLWFFSIHALGVHKKVLLPDRAITLAVSFDSRWLHHRANNMCTRFSNEKIGKKEQSRLITDRLLFTWMTSEAWTRGVWVGWKSSEVGEHEEQEDMEANFLLEFRLRIRITTTYRFQSVIFQPRWNHRQFFHMNGFIALSSTGIWNLQSHHRAAHDDDQIKCIWGIAHRTHSEWNRTPWSWAKGKMGNEQTTVFIAWHWLKCMYLEWEGRSVRDVLVSVRHPNVWKVMKANLGVSRFHYGLSRTRIRLKMHPFPAEINFQSVVALILM